MKVNPQAFFNFCARHVTLLRNLGTLTGEISEAEAYRVIKSQPDAGAVDELPETTWRRLREFQILVPTEPGSEIYLMAEPVNRLLTYLFDEANPATPEMVRGYIASLAALNQQLSRAMDEENITAVGLSFQEIHLTLRRIYADLDETHSSILNEVARFKTTRQSISVRDKFRRIVHWMERYVEPMIDIVRADGPMRAAFDASERLLQLARERALFNDHPAVERNLRYLRLVRRHALRVFQQCRKEIQPLYESLRRSSFIAEGAALALDQLSREGAGNWGTGALIGIFTLRFQNVPSDAAIALALRRLFDHPPDPAPILSLDDSLEVPPALLQRQWLDGLSASLQSELPVADLLQWLLRHHPHKSTAELLSGFTSLVFNPEFTARFSEGKPQDYAAADGRMNGHPLRLEKASS